MKLNKIIQFAILGNILMPLILIANVLSQEVVDQADTLIKEQMYLNKQKENFNNRKQQESKETKVFESKQIVVDTDRNEIECIQIKVINIRGSTLFDTDSFDNIKKPYLNHCNGLSNLTNLLNKITNMYIDKGYVTSRAYLKQQDLSDGTVDIDILEGKIEKIAFVNIQPLNFMNIYENEILNLRDLEVEIQQRDRLRSYDYNFQLIPGTQQGYSIVKIIANNINSPFYGTFSTNNFGSASTGKNQIALNTNYENLFGFDDIISLNFNTTNNIFKSHNYAKGVSVNYSFPIRRFLFDINYLYSKFNILSKNEFSNDIIIFGNSNTVSCKSNYKLYHGEKHSLELNGAYTRKENKNYLTIFTDEGSGNLISTTTSLTQQSYVLANAMVGIKHIYQIYGLNYYTNFNIIQGLAKQSRIDNEIPQNSEFIKYELELSFAKHFEMRYEPTYNFSLMGQITNKNVFATDEISIGGPYSVRGFNSAEIYGEKGFYIRNDFSLNSNIQNFRFSPYIGLDYGYIAHFKDYTQKANILGSTVGFKSSYNDIFMDLFYNRPLADNPHIKQLNSSFTGFTFSLNF